MDDITKRMTEKILLMSDPNSGYDIEDFEKEFKNIINKDINYDIVKINFNFKNESNNPDPEYATSGSSGFDLRANLTEPVTIKPHSFKIIPTGLYFEIPENFEIQIRPRSGLAAKNGVTVLNTPGTIDADYRGEIKVILINHSEVGFFVNHGDRIAQAVISSVIGKNIVSLNKVNNISENTERGSGGFGSTGIK